jgi:hypothetical protein
MSLLDFFLLVGFFMENMWFYIIVFIAFTCVLLEWLLPSWISYRLLNSFGLKVIKLEHIRKISIAHYATQFVVFLC